MKLCIKCNEVKENDEFNKRAASEDGLQIWCRSCLNEYNRGTNPQRMYIKGIGYIKKLDPQFKNIWRPGRFNSVLDIAPVSAIEAVPQGHVYIIYNPAFEGWFKVGCALDANDRLKSYQTSSPFRDYAMAYYEYFEDRKDAEKRIHKILKKHPKLVQYYHEWFMIDPYQIKKAFAEVREEYATKKPIDLGHRDQHGAQLDLGLCY